MNQILTATTALILALVLWGLGKKPNKSREKDHGLSLLTRLSTDKKSLVEPPKVLGFNESPVCFSSQKSFEIPKTIQERLTLKKQLHSAINAGPQERLDAVTIASLWGHPTVLPILRRGLRDSDHRVMSIAAAAIDKHRGKTVISKPQEKLRPPRNVSLMR